MADSRKEQERGELHRTIWWIVNDFCGMGKGWDFVQSIVGILFYRYISENLSCYINKSLREAGDSLFDYAKISDIEAEKIRQPIVNAKGFFILPSELFCNVLKRASSDDNLNETIERVFRHIEYSAFGTPSEDNLRGLFDDFIISSHKLACSVCELNKKLVKLLDDIDRIKLDSSSFTDNTIDIFGDAYDYLMGMYASNAGKSGGEYFTPQEVSELLVKLTTVGKTSVNRVYDPACGSGSLLLKFAKILGASNVKQGFYGQDISISMHSLCRINMFLHNIGFDKFDIALGDTLTKPKHWDCEPFDAIVSNPPYAIHWDGDDDPALINDPRFAPASVLAPKSKADLAFVLHSLAWLDTEGTAAIVCVPGVLYRGGKEKKIRKYLVDNNYIDSIIRLPSYLFYGTSIANCIIILKKVKQDNAVLFLDASDERINFKKINKITEKNINDIVNIFRERKNVEHISSLVSSCCIKDKEYNLSASVYIEK